MLVERLSTSLCRRVQEVIFLVGSPLSKPIQRDSPGVPDVEGIIELIRQEFAGSPTQSNELERIILESGEKRYHSAFLFLQGHCGQQAANEIVRTAVCSARVEGTASIPVGLPNRETSEEQCRMMDYDLTGWCVNPGTQGLADLATGYPERFGKTVLTTNFDPLIEVAIGRAGGNHFRTTLHADGNLSQTEGTGCHIIHLHGYWYGSDTLHTARQLGQDRPRLRASLRSLLKDKLVVAVGYGGWDDSFAEALMDVVRDDSAYPEVLWAFYDKTPTVSQKLLDRIGPGMDRGRVTLYSGVDCNVFFPSLLCAWKDLKPAATFDPPTNRTFFRASNSLVRSLSTISKNKVLIEGDDEDRPPLVELCVGRERELESVRNSRARIVLLTGLGGQGKSTIAAQYFSSCQRSPDSFVYYVWRDCKEESERFEIQLGSIIEKLSEGLVTARELVAQKIGSIVDIALGFMARKNILLVFDNADHYVNLETRKFTGSLEVFIQALVASTTIARVIFTCRPSLEYQSDEILNCHLAGIDLVACKRLFSERNASATPAEIDDAFLLTNGHAFWLDLLAIQTAKRAPAVTLSMLVDQIRSGSGPLPNNTLSSIWSGLRDRDRTVLRAMAETLKPETEKEIGDYVAGHLNYNKAMKAFANLRALNLVVIKRPVTGPDLYELHPLVRQFIRTNFDMDERLSYIQGILNTYRRFVARNKNELAARPSFAFLQHWTHNAELDLAAGDPNSALMILAESATAFRSSPYPREYSRAVRSVLASLNWVSDHAKYKAFEVVFKVHIYLLSHLGAYKEVDSLLLEYEKTVPERDARYISYCDLRCHAFWARGCYSEAVQWGTLGFELKNTSGVDTKFDVRHNLALAQRDAGLPEIALPVFLEGLNLAKVTDLSELDEKQTGESYGNIGRCLHLMGQIDSALICYQKSAILIEKDPRNEHAMNQGYVRRWIGELMMSRNQISLAAVFLRAASLKWEQVSPPNASRARALSTVLYARLPDDCHFSDDGAERLCLDWITGRAGS